MNHESDTGDQESRRPSPGHPGDPVLRAAIANLPPQQILELWQQAHGELAPRWKPEFLSRQEVAELAGMDARAVRWAIARSKRLADILTQARRWKPADRRPGPVAQSAPPSAGDSDPLRRSGAGRSGVATRYGSGMVRSPFRPEVRIPGGEICPSCGVRCLADGHCGCS